MKPSQSIRLLVVAALFSVTACAPLQKKPRISVAEASREDRVIRYAKREDGVAPCVEVVVMETGFGGKDPVFWNRCEYPVVYAVCEVTRGSPLSCNSMVQREVKPGKSTTRNYLWDVTVHWIACKDGFKAMQPDGLRNRHKLYCYKDLNRRDPMNPDAN